MKLELIFDMVKEKSYELRKKNPNNFDGQGFWQPIKKLLEPLDNKGSVKWLKISNNKVEKVMNLTEYRIDGYGVKKIDELNHFIIQQVRIPKTEKGTIKKIIQIALNIGQYDGMKGGKLSNKKINDFIKKSDIKKLSNLIDDNIIIEIKKYLDS